MAKILSVWAIDIGQSALKALKLVPGEDPDKLVAEAFDFIEYPKILSQPDAEPEELVREALTTFLERNEVKGSKVAIGVSGQAGLVKFIKLPPVEKARIPDIVKFEARQQIPFALEEVIWDWQRIASEDDADDGDDEGFSMVEVGLFAMKRDQINRAILPLKAAGIEVDIVQMGPIALYNFAAYDRAGDKAEDGKTGAAGQSVVYLDIGADNTDLIITDNQRIWQRNVPIGGNHFTRALTKELKLTFAKAELLKRNATKAPDPRSVFTAMRGIFNDFSSEINRSIGFFSSVNRSAKISRVVGLGNGFKLPGLQKFLSQNLSYEVERLEAFDRLVGDEVITAPQFQENLMSFAIAYGLAIQGMGKGPLRTNLLPPEIEQVRMIRRKKPWALAASALLFLGCSALFMSTYRAYAKVTSADFKSAVGQATSTSKRGAEFKTQYDAAKTAFNTTLEKGKQLISPPGDVPDWPRLLQTITLYTPDPETEAKVMSGGKLLLSDDNPADYDLLSKLRVHIDAIVPRYREDLKTWWESELGSITTQGLGKESMDPMDRDSPPSGPGWVVQIVGHHFNPSPFTSGITEAEKQIAKGSRNYIQENILPRFWVPELRVRGFHHAALTWFFPQKSWTNDVGSGPPAPLWDIETKASSGGGGGASDFGGGKGVADSMSAGGGMMGMNMGGGGDPTGASMGSRSAMGGMGSMGGMLSGMAGSASGGADPKAKLKTLTRTNFKIEFIWQPPAPDAKPDDLAEVKKKQDEARAKTKNAVAVIPNEDAMLKASIGLSEQALHATSARLKALGGPASQGKGESQAGDSRNPPNAPATKPNQ